MAYIVTLHKNPVMSFKLNQVKTVSHFFSFLRILNLQMTHENWCIVSHTFDGPNFLKSPIKIINKYLNSIKIILAFIINVADAKM